MKKVTVEVKADLTHGKQTLGVSVERRDNRFFVQSVVKGGESDGKLVKDDEVTHIDGNPIYSMTLHEFIECLRKRKGRIVMIMLNRCVEEVEEGEIPIKSDEQVQVRVPSNPALKNLGKIHTFQVDVIPGTLGLNIRKQPWDPSIGIEITMVKSDSQCFGKVKEGDWIVSVDTTSVFNFKAGEFGSLLKERQDARKTLTINRLENGEALRKFRALASSKYETGNEGNIQNSVLSAKGPLKNSSDTSKISPRPIPPKFPAAKPHLIPKTIPADNGGNSNSSPGIEANEDFGVDFDMENADDNNLTQPMDLSARATDTKSTQNKQSIMNNNEIPALHKDRPVQPNANIVEETGNPTTAQVMAKSSEKQDAGNDQKDNLESSLQNKNPAQPNVSKVEDTGNPTTAAQLTAKTIEKQDTGHEKEGNLESSLQNESQLATTPSSGKLTTVASASQSTSVGDDKSKKSKDPVPSNNVGDSNGNGAVQSDSSERSASTDQTQDKSLHKCEICGEKDGYLGCMNMQQCSACGISVHEQCYGLENEHHGRKYLDWKCHACASLGKTVKAQTRDTIVETTIKSRPKRCALCSIARPTTAMHPLYNTDGPGGKPILQKPAFQDEGILWVHTLCALALNVNIGTKGLIYGCNADGTYEGFDDDNEEGSNSDENSQEKKGESVCGLDFTFKDQNDSVLLFAAPNHFVINKVDPLAKIRVKDFRKEICCQFCKKDDSIKGIHRIPMQCYYSDCAVGFHVGCARWYEKESHIEFFSEVNDEASGAVLKESTSRGFCKKHFKVVKKKGCKEITDGKEMEEYGYERQSQTRERASLSLTLDDNEELYDDGDAKSSSDENNDVRVIAQSKQSKKRAHTVGGSETKKKSKTFGGESVYSRKKKLKEESSGKLLNDIKTAYEDCITNGDSWKVFGKKKNRILASWREGLPKGIYNKCLVEIEKDLDDLEVKFKREKSTMEAASKKNVAKRKASKNRWSNLFVPNYTQESIDLLLSFDLDSYEEISESEM